MGYLDGGARTDPTTQNLRRQFVLGMRDLGYNEGRDYLLEERYAACSGLELCTKLPI